MRAVAVRLRAKAEHEENEENEGVEVNKRENPSIKLDVLAALFHQHGRLLQEISDILRVRC